MKSAIVGRKDRGAERKRGMSESGKRLNDAIVQKVKKVLDNMDSTTSLYIRIDAEVGTIPTINYRITENIIPGEEESESI